MNTHIHVHLYAYTQARCAIRVCVVLKELTGKLPKEYPLDPGEEPPTVRRKIGTAFKLDEQKILPKGEVSDIRPNLT